MVGELLPVIDDDGNRRLRLVRILSGPELDGINIDEIESASSGRSDHESDYIADSGQSLDSGSAESSVQGSIAMYMDDAVYNQVQIDDLTHTNPNGPPVLSLMPTPSAEITDLDPSLGACKDGNSAKEMASMNGELCMYVNTNSSSNSAENLASICGDFSAFDGNCINGTSAKNLASVCGDICALDSSNDTCTSAENLASIDEDISASDGKEVGSPTTKISAGCQASIGGDMCMFGNSNDGSATRKLSAGNNDSVNGQLCVSVGKVSGVKDVEEQVRLMQNLSHGQEEMKEAMAGAGDQSKVDDGVSGMLEFGFKSLEEALTKKFEEFGDKLESEFKTEVLEGIQSGSEDLRGLLDLKEVAGETPSSIGGSAELGLVKEESLVGKVLPPGADKDMC